MTDCSLPAHFGGLGIAGGEIVSAVATLPLLLGEQAGQVSGMVARGFLDGHVTQEDEGALPVSDSVMTMLPRPGAALCDSGKRQD